MIQFCLIYIISNVLSTAQHSLQSPLELQLVRGLSDQAVTVRHVGRGVLEVDPGGEHLHLPLPPPPPGVQVPVLPPLPARLLVEPIDHVGVGRPGVAQVVQGETQSEGPEGGLIINY